MKLLSGVFFLALALMLVTMRAVEVPPEKNLLNSIEYSVSSNKYSTIDQVVNTYFEPGQPDFWSPKAAEIRWLKLTVSEVPSGEPVVIRVANRLMRSLELYQLTNEGWKVYRTGINIPIADRYTSSAQFGFPVNSSKTGDQTYYLKVSAATRTHLDIDAISLRSDSALSLQKNILRGFVFTITLVLLLIALTQFYFENKDTLFIYFAGCQLASLLSALLDSSFFHLFDTHADVEAKLFMYSSLIRLTLPQILTARIIFRFDPPAFYKVALYVSVFVWIVAGLLVQENNALIVAVTVYALHFPLALIQLLALNYCKSITPTDKKLTFHFFFGVFIIQSVFVAFWLVNATTFVAYQTSLAIGLQCGIGIGYFIFIHQQRREQSQRAATIKQDLEEVQRLNKTQEMLLNERTLLIDILTHQIKNPLATIKMAVDYLQRRPHAISKIAEERITKISKSSEEINEILEHCYLINALDNRAIKPTMAYSNLKDLLDNLSVYRQNQTRFFIEVPETLLVFTDKTYLSIVFTNILDNALKYGDPDQAIYIRKIDAEPHNQHEIVTIAISNKVGIHGAPSHKHLFERFYRASISTNTFGMGLGLYICGSICQLLEIQINFEVIQEDVVFTLSFEE